MLGSRSSGGGSPNPLARGGALAVLAAVSFGVSTPLIQRLAQASGAFATATLLYAGAAAASLGGTGSKEGREAPVRRRHVRRLVLVALAGAVFAPACFAWGLQHTSASGASLLLHFEAVFTVLLAWRLYHEPIGGRVAVALSLMVAGGACLVFGGHASGRVGWGAAAVVASTLGWAIDNTLTRPLADLNPTQVVRWKGALGAAFGLVASVLLRERFPSPAAMLGLLAIGATGYGLSLRLYLLAQRGIGAGRTGSIFALAPFVGAATAWAMGDRTPGLSTAVAAALFAVGVCLHLTERHRHLHTHEPIDHEHAHRHDDGHHDHPHQPPVEGEHSHAHRHDVRTHDHPHAPDAHHLHRHE
ncbi:MAG TPA: DMT family transporter [Polyangiaceae bacterium]|nr:DMT family transporter [Polyangiaceae bacterium]